MKNWPRIPLVVVVVSMLPAEVVGAVRVSDSCPLAVALEQVAGLTADAGCVSDGVVDSTILISEDVVLGSRIALPVIDASLILRGVGVPRIVVSPGGTEEPFLEVAESGDVTIESLEIAGGSIESRGRLRLVHATLSESAATAVVNHGELELIDTVVRDARGDGVASLGGNLRVVNSRIADSAGVGLLVLGNEFGVVANSTIVGSSEMGVYASGNEAFVVMHSELSSNGDHGLEVAGTDAPANVMTTTIANNGGHGVELDFARADIRESTISGNAKDGVFNDDMGGGVLVNTTVTGNGAMGVRNPGYFGGETRIERSVIAGNDSGDCSGVVSSQGGGSSFDSDGTCPGSEPMGGLDPVLADNGGATRTHALLPGSPAVDADDFCRFAADQRGYLVDELCDAGAFELVEPAIVLGSSATCPATMTFTITGVTPNAGVSLQVGRRPGRDSFTEGSCAGSPSAIRAPTELFTGAADRAGTAILEVEVGPEQCGKTLQAIDLELCTMSTLTPVGRPPE